MQEDRCSRGTSHAFLCNEVVFAAGNWSRMEQIRYCMQAVKPKVSNKIISNIAKRGKEIEMNLNPT